MSSAGQRGDFRVLWSLKTLFSVRFPKILTPKVCQQGLEAPGATVVIEVRSLDVEKAFM